MSTVIVPIVYCQGRPLNQPHWCPFTGGTVGHTCTRTQHVHVHSMYMFFGVELGPGMYLHILNKGMNEFCTWKCTFHTCTCTCVPMWFGYISCKLRKIP